MSTYNQRHPVQRRVFAAIALVFSPLIWLIFVLTLSLPGLKWFIKDLWADVWGRE